MLVETRARSQNVAIEPLGKESTEGDELLQNQRENLLKLIY